MGQSRRRVHASVEELYNALQANVVGNSSSLYIWDSQDEDFKPTSSLGDRAAVLAVEGLGELTVAKYVRL